jgi:hypothetical protein
LHLVRLEVLLHLVRLPFPLLQLNLVHLAVLSHLCHPEILWPLYFLENPLLLWLLYLQ